MDRGEWIFVLDIVVNCLFCMKCYEAKGLRQKGLNAKQKGSVSLRDIHLSCVLCSWEICRLRLIHLIVLPQNVDSTKSNRFFPQSQRTFSTGDLRDR